MDDDEELRPIGVANYMVNKTVIYAWSGNAEKNVGISTDDSVHEIDEDELISIHQHQLNEIYKVVRDDNLTWVKLACTSSWVLDKTLREELVSICNDAHDFVDEIQLNENANVIPFHVVYKLKAEKGS